MVSFIQVPIEQKVGKGYRILGPLKRDPSIEVSAYRDNQFKVFFQSIFFLNLTYNMSFRDSNNLFNIKGNSSRAG